VTTAIDNGGTIRSWQQVKGENMKNYYIKFIAVGFAVLLMAFGLNAQTKHARLTTQRARIQITENGYQPGSVKLRRGVPSRITFLRTTDATCAKEIVIADYGIRRSLPLNQPVVVSFTPRKTGDVGFACGMNMMRGKIIVR